MEKNKCENCGKITDDFFIYEDGLMCEDCYDHFEPEYSECEKEVAHHEPNN